VDFETIKKLVKGVMPESRSATQLGLAQIIQGLQCSGFDIPERTVRRQIKGLKVCKGPGGYYSPADAALLLGWNMRREQYSSYSEFYNLEGVKLYEIAQTQLC
jgi:hypothetical protein